MTQPPPRAVGGGAFDVDITQAPQAIRQLEQALEELRSIRQDATLLGHITPPTTDQVSIDAARALGMTATGGPTSFLAALEAGIAELDRMIQALRAGLSAYQEGDEQGRSRLSISS
ncbi:hypothetical protein GCM10023200_17120 [Actinomycetospora chlora]|uniref:PE domain-containing protein n=1 Tax=Actinomycetospora chlora TaxID=663608 RepID=A0ABP9AQ52_9PSEU